MCGVRVLLGIRPDLGRFYMAWDCGFPPQNSGLRVHFLYLTGSFLSSAKAYVHSNEGWAGVVSTLVLV